MWLLTHTNAVHNSSMVMPMAVHADYSSFLGYSLWLYPGRSQLASNHLSRDTVMLVWFVLVYRPLAMS